MNIYESLNAIMRDLPAIPKNRRLEINGRLQYNFRGVDDIYSALQPLLIKHKVFSVPRATITNIERVETKNGYTNRVIMSVEYYFYAEDGSHIYCLAIGEGMDTGDKASNKAMSAAHKYALLQLFCIPTEEPKDSENEHHEVEKKSTVRSQAPSASSTTPPSRSSNTTTENEIQEPGDYVITFGKHKDKTVKELVDAIGMFQVASYVGWLEKDASVKKKPLGQSAQDFKEAFDAFVGTSELDRALSPPVRDKSVHDQLERLKNQFPGVPGAPMPKAYKDSDDEIPWPENE